MTSARTLLSLVLLTLPLAAQKSEPPPGMVAIGGDRVTIGTDWKDLESFIADDETLLGPLAPEHPEHSVKVEDFFLSVTETTNEQYAAFVSATGWRPPAHWAPQDKVDEARFAFLEEEGRLREEAKQAGEPLPERKKFNDADWYAKNWQEAGWKIPDGLAKHPVIWVSYQDASAYARWAGLRLMSEAEYQLAVRGKTDNPYPWGPEWTPDNCVFRDTPDNSNRPFPVGTKPAGASPEGVFDLIGNVWEWTSTPFTPYEKWKAEKVSFGKGKAKREKIATVAWDPNSRVAVGGSYQNSGLAMRCTTRRPIERFQTTEGMGFRCAASPEPGKDVADAVMREDLPTEKRPTGIVYDLERATGADRWESTPGEGQGPDKYAVITSYEALLFFPVEKIDLATVKTLAKLSLETGPQHLGIISITRDALVPPISAGTYMMAFRGAGADPEPEVPVEGEEAEEADPAVQIEYPQGFDKDVDNFVFFDAAMKVAAFLPITTIQYDRAQQPRVEIGSSTYPVTAVDEEGVETVTNVPCDQALFVVATPGPGRNGFNYEVPLKFERDALGKGWRTR